jgi:uncharacterized protein YegP (UPF0339 family)
VAVRAWGSKLTRRKEWVVPTGYEYFTIERRAGGYRGYFYAANDELVWRTETYDYKVDAAKAIRLIKAEAASAPVKDRA